MKTVAFGSFSVAILLVMFLYLPLTAFSQCTIAGCSSCRANGACRTCSSGYYLSGGTCIACSTNCLACTSTSCTSCNSGYTASGTNCLNTTCVANCQTCTNSTSSTTCTSCNSGYSLDSSNLCQVSSSNASSSSSGSNVGLIVGVVVGVTCALAIVIFIIVRVYCCRR